MLKCLLTQFFIHLLNFQSLQKNLNMFEKLIKNNFHASNSKCCDQTEPHL